MTYHQTDGGALAAAAMASLEDAFATWNHRPSKGHLDALEAIASTMDDMANGVCPPDFLLASVDPGIGKSQTVVHFVKALMASDSHRHVGMMICVGRIAEAKALAEALADFKTDLAVFTKDASANALGGAPDVNSARVLVTTQQRLEKQVKRCGSFGAASDFYFQDAPRAVRVWDEAFVPGHTAQVCKDDLMHLLKDMGRVSVDVRDAMETFALTLKGHRAGGLVDVPDFNADGALDDLMERLSEDNNDDLKTTEALKVMGGGVAVVSSDGPAFGNTILTYENTLPADLAPLLVLDASVRVRTIYDHMIRSRQNVVRLCEATKDYGPLTVRIWRKSGSKSGFDRDGATLADGIAATIKTRPDEEWLAVIHKKAPKRDVEADVRRRLGFSIDAARVHFVSWGQHLATNAYGDVSNVILAGTLFMRQSHYTAATHLAQDRSVASGPVSREDVKATEAGEHADRVLQAVCRGQVRKSDGSRCQPMDAYIIAATASGIPDSISGIFPGCTVETWNPVAPKLKGKLKAAVAHVRKRIEAGATEVTLASVCKAMRMRTNNFYRSVTSKPAWRQHIEAMGLTVVKAQRNANVLKLGSPCDFPA